MEAKELKIKNQEINFNNFERISFKNIDMSKRLSNWFFKTGEITYLDEISQFKKHEILMFRNIGIKRLFELEQIMEKYNIKFKPE
jgi:DNA-directed RNA polymerase alpha subunit